MAKKITELTAVETLLTTAKLLITQDDGGTDVARLATATQVANVIKTILSLDSTYASAASVASLISDVSGKGDGLVIENDMLYLTSDGEIVSEGVSIASQSGLAFDEITFEDGYLHILNEGEDVVDPCYIGGGGGGGGTTVTIRNKMSSKSITIAEPETTLPMLYNVTDTDEEDELTLSWFVGGVRVARQTGVEQGDGSFDIRPYLTTGVANTVKLTAEDSYGSTKSFTWTVTVSAYNIAWTLDEMAVHGSTGISVPITAYGIGDKTVKVKLDGTLIFSQVVSLNGRKVTVDIGAQDHGAHELKAWLEVEIDGDTIETTPLRHVGIWTEPEETDPIIALLEDEVTVPQYGTSQIKFMVYDPLNEAATITKSINMGTPVTETVDRSMQIWAYRPVEIGTDYLTLACRTETETIEVTVTSSGYDINPVTRSLAAILDPSGHTNQEANRNQFGYKDGSDVNHPLTFSANFDWTNGGFQRDDDGITALVIKRGTYVALDRSLFNDNAKMNGKEIKIIFKATECRDYDAVIAHCLANNIGLVLGAQQATLSSALKSATLQYCEEKKIEMDINIEASNEDKLAVVWLEGVPARAFAYSDEDGWQQNSPEVLTIGSDDCDVWLYGFKLYDASLMQEEILDNFIADCADVEEMIARYERNDIYNQDGSISEEKLANVKPELRIVHIRADRMTTAKTDEVICDVTLNYPAGGPDYCFEAEGVIMKAQGTSSLEYGLAALNLDLDFKNATSWVDGNGDDITGYAMSEHAIPVNYINLKVNVASSENANNVCMADDYNTFQPYIKAARKANPYVRDCIEGHPAAIFLTNTAQTAITVGARTVQPGETILYAVGDFCNSKKNNAVFGQDNTTYPMQCCIEIHNNNNPQCRFKDDDLTGETWDGKDGASYDTRYPKTLTQDHKDAWQTMLSWVVSTDTTAATNASLLEPVTYNGTTYTKDTAAYRAAKFKAELADHFAVDSLLYHYLTTNRRLLPDNRAKNTFFEYDYDEDAEGYRWNIVHGYDFDTMSGNDNSGGLTFTYGMEDTDMVGASYVFNASDSVLWCNLRDFFADELEAMYNTLESAGAWSSTRILAKWKAYRDCRPEALLIADMWNKYFAPYIYANEERYIRAMLGTKEDQLIQFETYQEPYMASKYGSARSTSDRISLRANAPQTWYGVEPSGDIDDIVPYADTYITVKYGNAGSVKIRATRGENYDIEMPQGATLNDLETYIYGASNIASIGSLAGLYTKLADMSSAKKLRQALLGSGETGYSNPSFGSDSGTVSFGNNVLMEVIDLRGTPNLVQGLNLAALKALEEIYTENSGITGITFARRAPLRIAELNPLRQLIARDLTELETFSMAATNLQTLWVENCATINTQTLVANASGLTHGRLIGVNWTLDSVRLLKRLTTLGGLDVNGNTTNKFVLTGSVYVEQITSEDYAEITGYFGSGLTLTYGQLIPSYTVTFKNYDGSTLNTQMIGYGSAPEDPVTDIGITTPTRPDDAAATYTWVGWSSANGSGRIQDLSALQITADTTIWAFYTSAGKSYTVQWKNGSTVLDTKTVNYGEDAEYYGDDPVYPGLDGIDGIYHLFKGWDKSGGSVCEDLVISAVYEEGTHPGNTPTTQMTATNLKALVGLGILDHGAGTNTSEHIITSGDDFTIIAGRDGDYANVTSHTLIPLSSPKIFDGTSATVFKPQTGDGYDYLLWDEDKSWTLAIDFEFDSTTTANGCLAAACQSDGFKLKYSSGGQIAYGLGTQQVSSTTARQIVIIRKRKGDANLYVYASNKNANDIVTGTLSMALAPTNNAPLAFGAQIFSNGSESDYGKGTVYWAKLWDTALSDAECKELAIWPRQTWVFQAVGSSDYQFNTYEMAEGTEAGQYNNCSFLMKYCLSDTHQMNTVNLNYVEEEGETMSWKGMPIRKWLAGHVFDGLPKQWQQLIKTVVVHTTKGNKITDLEDPALHDKLWLPCAKDMGVASGAGYNSESNVKFNIFVDNNSRIKRLTNSSGSATVYWLRSPVTTTSYAFYNVTQTGSGGNYTIANSAYGIAFGFCI